MAKLLLIGSLTNKKDPSKTGGVTVLFELLISELKQRNIEFDVIDVLKENYPTPAIAFFSSVYQLIKNFHKYDHISLQASTNSFILLGPLMVLLSKLFKKKTSMRKFAGNFHEIHAKSTGIKKYLIEYVLKNCDYNFFETKYLVDYFKVYNPNTFWFPNVRKKVDIPLKYQTYQKRFVFIGTINQEKGIDELLDVREQLSDDYIIDLYGPIIETKYEQILQNSKINYCGALKSEEVLKVLSTYNVLLLPSYREGYPGIIIEAFSLGLPIIATKLDGIMEIVEDKKNGLLIDVKDSKQLIYAMESIDERKYQEMSRESKKSFDDFDSEKETELFLKRIGFSK